MHTYYCADFISFIFSIPRTLLHNDDQYLAIQDETTLVYG